MNIFILNRDPVKAAQQHNDKHVVKMIVESAQMLSTAHRRLDGQPMQAYFPRRFKIVDADGALLYRIVRLKEREMLTLPGDEFRSILGHTIFRGSVYYRDTHANHPCSIWCRENASNYEWLWQLTNALCDEYYVRYGKAKGKHHKLRESGLLDLLATPPANIPQGDLTPFAIAMPDEYKVDDIVQSYKNYYLGEKTGFMKYTNRDMPDWVERGMFKNTLKHGHDRPEYDYLPIG